MTVILELDLAYRPQPNDAYAGMVIVKKLVGYSEIAGLVLPVVEVSRDKHLISEEQQLAPSAFQILRRGEVRQPVGFHCVIDRHIRILRFFNVFPFRYAHIRSKRG